MNNNLEEMKKKATELFAKTKEEVNKIEVKELLNKSLEKSKKITAEMKVQSSKLLEKEEGGSLNITSKVNGFFDGINVKLMGSYKEIEAFEKERESNKSA